MTTGSPVAFWVSGPGTALTKAMRLPSGDQAMLLPDEGRGLFVPFSGEINFAVEPSGRATINPDWAPSLPSYPIHWLSGDHSGFDDVSLSPPSLIVLPSATVIIQS